MDSLDKTERSHILTLSDEPEPKDAFLFATPDLLRPLLAVTTTTPPEGDTAETPVWYVSSSRFHTHLTQHGTAGSSMPLSSLVDVLIL